MDIEVINRAPRSLALSLGLGLSLVAFGCADDTTPGGTDEVGGTAETGDTGDTGTGGESGDGMNETGTDTDTGDGTDTGTDTGPSEIIVGGEVTDFFTMTGIEGANVSVKDMPGFETVSGVDGVYEFMGMPPSTEVFFLIDGNEADYWGGVRPAMLPATDIDDLQLGQISNMLIDTQLNLLNNKYMPDPPIVADEMKSVIIVRLLQPTAVGAMVDFQPPLPMGTYYSADADNSPVLDNTVIESSLLPFWVAFDVDPDDVGGAYSIEVTHPERECTVLHPVFPTLPRYVTLVDVDCPPMP